MRHYFSLLSHIVKSGRFTLRLAGHARRSAGFYFGLASANGVVTIASGTAITATGWLVSMEVEVYGVAFSLSGNPEGLTYLGTAPAGVDGKWSLPLPAGAGVCLTVFESFGFLGAYSGEFGPNTCRVMIPRVQK